MVHIDLGSLMLTLLCTLARDADGILLLEANRMLRAGGYFIWAAKPVDKHEDNLQEQWKGNSRFQVFYCFLFLFNSFFTVLDILRQF